VAPPYSFDHFLGRPAAAPKGVCAARRCGGHCRRCFKAGAAHRILNTYMFVIGLLCPNKNESQDTSELLPIVPQRDPPLEVSLGVPAPEGKDELRGVESQARHRTSLSVTAGPGYLGVR